MKRPRQAPRKKRAESARIRIVAAKIIGGFWKTEKRQQKHEFFIPISDKLDRAIAEGWEPLNLSVDSHYYHVLLVRRA